MSLYGEEFGNGIDYSQLTAKNIADYVWKLIGAHEARERRPPPINGIELGEPEWSMLVAEFRPYEPGSPLGLSGPTVDHPNYDNRGALTMFGYPLFRRTVAGDGTLEGIFETRSQRKLLWGGIETIQARLVLEDLAEAELVVPPR